MFSTLCGSYFSFQVHFKMSSAVCCFDLNQSKTLSSGNALNQGDILSVSRDTRRCFDMT